MSEPIKAVTIYNGKDIADGEHDASRWPLQYHEDLIQNEHMSESIHKLHKKTNMRKRRTADDRFSISWYNFKTCD